MKALFVSAALLLAGAAGAPAARAQRVRADARIRVADGIVIGVSVGHPYAYRAVIRPRARVDRRYRAAYWRAYEARHERWHRAMARENERRLRALARGRISEWQYRAWLRATDRRHDELFGVLGHRYGDRRWDPSPTRGRPGLEEVGGRGRGHRRSGRP